MGINLTTKLEKNINRNNEKIIIISANYFFFQYRAYYNGKTTLSPFT